MKKKIMFIVPSLCGGGAEKTIANLSKYLIKDYDIDIVVFKDTDMKYDYSGNLIILSKNLRRNILYKFYFFVSSVLKLKQLKKNRKVDYAISFLTTADIINVLSKVKNTKTIISIRNTDSIYTNKIMNYMTKISCVKADKIISISEQVKTDLVNNYNVQPEKIKTIYNPSISVKFSKKNHTLDKGDFGDFTFINVGRLTYQKGQWHLIRSFSEVVKKYPNSKLIILGQGELKDYLQNLIDEYSLNSNVVLKGFVDNPYDYFNKSDCFVFSSLFEGLGNVLLEALNCEIPIISTDCISGPREILAPKTNFEQKVKDKSEYSEFGILVPVFDGNKYNYNDKLTEEEKILSNVMCSVINDKKILNDYKKKSKIRAKDFEINKIKNEWVNFLESL